MTLGIIGFLAFIVCIVFLIWSAIKKRTKRYWAIGTLLCITLPLVAVLCSCGSSGPSYSEARNAVLDEVQTWASAGDSEYIGVEDAEIVEIAKMTKHPWAEEFKVWPMRLYLIKQGSKVKCEGWLFKNSFGEWKASIQYNVQ